MEPGHSARVVATRLLFAALIAALAWTAPTPALAQIVEWRVEDGGNGHAYTILSSHQPGTPISWWEARAKAESAGGHLATLATEAEAGWVFAHVVSQSWIWPSAAGPWIGALRCEFLDARGRVQHAWRWIDGTPWSWDPWSSFLCAPPVDDCPKGPESALCLVNPSGLALPSPAWTCAEPFGGCPPAGEGSSVVYALVEFDQDCNENGRVDRIEVRDGLVADRNTNFIPDDCECLYDLDGDGFIGDADVAILMANFGEPGVGDLDGNGLVDLDDLALLLEAAGPCRYCAIC
jgi:hypothetical protein